MADFEAVKKELEGRGYRVQIFPTGAAAADYLRFLSGGCSTDPVSLLKLAGVDMSTPQPVQDALDLFGRLTEELEDLLA